MINKIPTLKVLDFTKVKEAEREKAKRLAMSAAGAALESDVRLEARNAAAAASTASGTKTFVPGEGRSAEESFTTQFTKEQKEQIRKMVAEASSPEEIERIETSVKRGVFPTPATSAPAGDGGAATPTLTAETGTATGAGPSKKRPIEGDETEEENASATKKIRAG